MSDGRVEILKSKLSGQLAVSVDGHRFGPKASPWQVDPKLSWSMGDRALVKAPPSIEELRRFAREHADGDKDVLQFIQDLERDHPGGLAPALLRAVVEVFNPYG
jgi:hypothetical protein